MVLALAACAGDGATTTTAEEGGVTTTAGAEETTTTAAPSDDDGGTGGTVGLDDIPQECIEAFALFLQAIEPIIEDLDFDNLSLEDLEAIGEEIDPAMVDYEAEIAATGCDDYDVDIDADDDESFDFLIDIARDEAPGTVPYLEWVRDFVEGAGQEATGDCDADLAAMDAIIAEGGTMQSLSVGEITYVGSLMSSIQFNCDPETTGAFFARSDVQDFVGSGG